MKSFLFRLLAFLFPFILTFVVAELFIRSIPNDYSFKNDFLTKNASKLEVLFLGNSHAYYGLNPKYIVQKSFNAAHVSQSLAYDLELFKKFKSQFTKLKVIAIPVSYFSLHFNIEGGKEAWREKNYCIYYQIYRSKKLSNYFEVASNSVKTNYKIVSEKIKNNKNLLKSDNNGWQIHDSIFYKNIEKNAKRSSKRHTYKITKNLIQNIAILNEFVERAQKMNIKVLFYTTPVTKTYYNLLNKKQVAERKEILSKLSNNKTVFFKDWINENSFENEYFYDADHLNDKGSIKFSKLMNETLKEINSSK